MDNNRREMALSSSRKVVFATGERAGHSRATCVSARWVPPANFRITTEGNAEMRLYIAVTGVTFALLVVAHLARMIMESSALATDPVYLLITATSAGLSIWAWIVFRGSRPPGQV